MYLPNGDTKKNLEMGYVKRMTEQQKNGTFNDKPTVEVEDYIWKNHFIDSVVAAVKL